MKRKILFIILAACVLALVGCSSDSGSGSSGMTRAQFIGLLGEEFGYQDFGSDADLFDDVNNTNENYAAIQAAAEWNVLEKGGDFKPDEKATLGFALDSAVRAIDTAKIAQTGAKIEDGKLSEFFAENIAEINTDNLEKSVSEKTAKQILSNARDYRNKMVRKQVTEAEYCDGVIEDKGGIILNADGMTGRIQSGTYNVGDIVYFNGGGVDIARAIKITGIDGDKITYENATFEQTFKSLKVSGTFPGKIISATTATSSGKVSYGRDLLNELNSYARKVSYQSGADNLEIMRTGVSCDKGSDHIIFKVPFECEASNNKSAAGIESSAGGSAELTVGIQNFSIDADYDWKWQWGWPPAKFTEIKFGINFDTIVRFNASGYAGLSIPLGEVNLSVWGPVSVKISLIANIGVDGAIDINYTTTNEACVMWKDGSGFSRTFDSNPRMTVNGEATLTAEATALAELRVGLCGIDFGVANAEVTTGVVCVVKADADLLNPNIPACVDVLVYVPLRWGVNQKGCVLTDINSSWKYSATIWDSTNSPIQKHFHFENGVRTPDDKCTRGDEQEVVTENTDENGEPYNEYHMFEFEPLDFDFVELVSYTMFIDIGSRGKIELANIPKGYTEADLVYSSDDQSICTIANGYVNGIQAGSTIVRIGTNDGAYEVALAVTVRGDYAVDNFNTL